MKRQVWKYELTPGFQLLTMPIKAKLLHVAFQYGLIYLWALVDEEQPVKGYRRILLVKTGININNELPSGNENLKHIGTCFSDEEGSHHVFHAFEVI